MKKTEANILAAAEAIVYRHRGTYKKGVQVSGPVVGFKTAIEYHVDMCEKLRSCVDRHKLGDVGERLDSIVIRELDRIKMAEDCCVDPCEDDSNDPMSRTIPRASLPPSTHEAPAEIDSGTLLDELTNAFLRWPLPESVRSDMVATMQGNGRCGTNLLSFTEARQMFRDVVGPRLRSMAQSVHPAVRSNEEVAALTGAESLLREIVREQPIAIDCRRHVFNFLEKLDSLRALQSAQPVKEGTGAKPTADASFVRCCKNLLNGGPFDLQDSPQSFMDNVRSFVREHEAAVNPLPAPSSAKTEGETPRTDATLLEVARDIHSASILRSNIAVANNAVWKVAEHARTLERQLTDLTAQRDRALAERDELQKELKESRRVCTEQFIAKNEAEDSLAAARALLAEGKENNYAAEVIALGEATLAHLNPACKAAVDIKHNLNCLKLRLLTSPAATEEGPQAKGAGL